MKRGYYTSLVCEGCGHHRIVMVEDLPPEWLDEGGVTIRPEVLARMRCAHCGRVGRPDLRIGWSTG